MWLMLIALALALALAMIERAGVSAAGALAARRQQCGVASPCGPADAATGPAAARTAGGGARLCDSDGPWRAAAVAAAAFRPRHVLR